MLFQHNLPKILKDLLRAYGVKFPVQLFVECWKLNKMPYLYRMLCPLVFEHLNCVFSLLRM